jgi:hypothetical protein
MYCQPDDKSTSYPPHAMQKPFGLALLASFVRAIFFLERRKGRVVQLSISLGRKLYAALD